MLPPVALQGRAQLVAASQPRFGVSSSSNISLGNESTPEVNATYNATLSGTKVAGAVVAGSSIKASNQAAAFSMKANNQIELSDTMVQSFVQGGSVDSRQSSMGSLTGSTLTLQNTKVQKDAQAVYSLTATGSTFGGNVSNSNSSAINLSGCQVEGNVKTSGTLELKKSIVKGAVDAGNVNGSSSQAGRVKGTTITLNDSKVFGPVQGVYSISIQDTPIEGDVSNSQSSGITLTNAPVDGNVTSTGTVTLKNTKVTGDVNAGNLDANRSAMRSAKATTISLTHSPVAGKVEGVYSITADHSPIGGTVSNSQSSSITLKASPVQGDLSTKGNLTLENSSVEGDVRAGNVTAQSSGMKSLTATTVELKNSPVQGDILAVYGIQLSGSAVSGNVSNTQSSSLALTQSPVKGYVKTSGNLTLDRSNVTGDVNAGNVTAKRSDTGNLTGTSIELDTAKVDGDVKGVYSVQLKDTEVTGSVSNSQTSTLTLNGSQVKKDIQTKGNVQLDRTSVGGQIAATRVTANQCQSLGSIVANNGLELKNSTVTGPVSIDSHAEIHNSTLQDTLTCKPAYTLKVKNPEEKDPAKRDCQVICQPVVLSGKTSVGSIVVKAAKYPSKKEIEDMKTLFVNPDLSFLSIRTTRTKLTARQWFNNLLIKLHLRKKPEVKEVVDNNLTGIAPGETPSTASNTQAPQVVELRGQATVTGSINFEGGNGQVVVYPSTKFEGTVTGGEVKVLTEVPKKD